MPLATVPVTWRAEDWDGGGATLEGVLTLRPAPGLVRYTDLDGTRLVVGVIQAPIVAGVAVVDVPASDQDGLEPSGFTWTVAEHLRHSDTSGRTYPVAVTLADQAEGINLAEVARVPSSLGESPGLTVAQGNALLAEVTEARDEAEDAADLATAPTAEVLAAEAADDASPFLANLTRNGKRPVGRGEQAVNICDHGAVATPGTDNAAALAAAFTEATARGCRRLYVPAGTYEMTAVPDLPAGWRVDAEDGAVFKLTAAQARFWDGNQKAGWRIFNLAIDLNGYVTSEGIRWGTGAQNHVLHRVKVYSSRPLADGIFGIKWDSGAINCHAIRCHLDGLRNPAQVRGAVVRCGLSRSRVTGFGERGLFVLGLSTEASQDFWFEDNIVRDPGRFRIVTSKAVTAGVATLTLDVSKDPNPYVVGESFNVQGMGAPFDGAGRVVTSRTTTTVKFAVPGEPDLATTAVVKTGNLNPAVLISEDPVQPVAVQIADGGPRHAGLRANRNLIEGTGLAHHLTLTGDPESGILLGGIADGISLHGCFQFQCNGNEVRDGGEVGITIGNTSLSGDVNGNTITRSNTVAIACQDVSWITCRGNTAVDCGQDKSATPKRAGSGSAWWTKDCVGITWDDNLALGTAGFQTSAFYFGGTGVPATTGPVGSNADIYVGPGNRLGGDTVNLVNTGSTATGKAGVTINRAATRLRQTGDVTRADGTLTAHPTFKSTIQNGGTYRIILRGRYAATQAADLGFRFTSTVGTPTVNWQIRAPQSGNVSAGSISTQQFTSWVLSSTAIAGGAGAAGAGVGQDVAFEIVATIETGTTTEIGVQLNQPSTPDAANPSVLRDGAEWLVQRIAA